MRLLKPSGRVQTLFAIAWLGVWTSACGGSEPDASSGEAAVGGGSTPSVPPTQGPKAGSSAPTTPQGGSSVAATPATRSKAPAAGSGSASIATSAGGAGAPAQAAAGASGASLGAAGAAASTAGAAGAATGAAGGGSASPAQGTRPQATTLKYATMMESVAEAPYFNIYRPTNLDEPGGLLPVVAWANGGCVREESNWRPLFDAWAAAGIVTLALTTSPNGTLFDMTTKDDHKALIDWIAAQDKKDGSPYAGKLDLTKIVTSGNSCGGVTALEVAAADKRVTAVFVLSGSSALGDSDPAIMKEIKIPVAYVTGNPDEDIAAPNALTDYDLLPDGVPAMMVNRSMGDHPTVSTDPMIMKESAEMSLNFIDLAFFGTPQAADALMTPTVCTGCAMGEWKFKSKNLETLRH